MDVHPLRFSQNRKCTAPKGKGQNYFKTDAFLGSSYTFYSFFYFLLLLNTYIFKEQLWLSSETNESYPQLLLLLETLYNSSTLCLFWLQRLSRLKQILGPKWQKVSTDYLVVWGSDISISFPFNPSESSSTPAANVKIFHFHAYSARTGQRYIRTLQTTHSLLQLWVQPLRVCGGLSYTTSREAALAHQVPPIILREKQDSRLVKFSSSCQMQMHVDVESAWSTAPLYLKHWSWLILWLNAQTMSEFKMLEANVVQ